MLLKITARDKTWYDRDAAYATMDHCIEAFVKRFYPDGVKRGESNQLRIEVHEVNASDDGRLVYNPLAARTFTMLFAKMTRDEWNEEYRAAVKKHGSLVAQQAYKQACDLDYDALAERFRAALPK